jgi:hypothetical protein
VVQVTWDGISASYALRIGFLRLLHLIANPKQVISCIEIVRVADGTSIDSGVLPDEDLSDGFHPDYLDNWKGQCPGGSAGALPGEGF